MNNTWWVKPDDLDDQQKAVIDLPLKSSHLIVGPPGSGKTNLLLLRASQMVLSGKPNILVIVFTRTLREFVVTGGHQYAFGADNIVTFNNWSYQFLRDQGIKEPAKDADFKTQRLARLEQIKSVVAEKKLSAVYDAIVLDEAQDYFPEELDALCTLGRVVFAAADARQQIYPTVPAAASAIEQKFAPRVHTLKHHYRNGAKICDLADEFAKVWGAYPPLKPTSNYDEKKNPSSVEIHECADISAQVAKAVKAIATQLKAYPDELLGILCPNRVVLKEASSLLKASSLSGSMLFQSGEEGYVPFEEGKPVCVCTIHGAKGLEFRAVHVLGAESMYRSPLNRNIAYLQPLGIEGRLGQPQRLSNRHAREWKLNNQEATGNRAWIASSCKRKGTADLRPTVEQALCRSQREL